MEYVNLKGTDLIISAVALGTGAFGSEGRISTDTAVRILDTFVEKGGTFIDTANIYGRWDPAGKPISEIIIGKWLRRHGERDKIIIGTKGGTYGTTSKRELKETLENSLKNLGRDHVDIYYLHHDNPKIPAEELVESAGELIKLGYTQYIACSNWKAHRMKSAMDYAKAHRIPVFSANESLLTLASLNRESLYKGDMYPMDEDIYRLHCETGLPVIAYSSQAMGIFTLVERSDFLTSDKYMNVRTYFDNPITRGRIERVKLLAEKKGLTSLHIVHAYLHSHPFQVIPIIGPWEVKELDESLACIGSSLNDEEKNFLLNGYTI
jgi:aryl-alcohol dehydrogenase-like predicted oxidoreductase